jgi:hypothetical protein
MVAVIVAAAIAFGLDAHERDGLVAQTTIEVGSEVEIVGPGGCVNVYSGLSTESDILECVSVGTRSRVADTLGGFSGSEPWWLLAGHGWIEQHYLRATAPPEPNIGESQDPWPDRVRGLRIQRLAPPACRKLDSANDRR